MLRSSRLAAVVFAAAAFFAGGAKAQTVACQGPTAGNCVAAAQVAPGIASGQTAVTGVFSGADTTTAAASLAATAGKTNFVCEISIDGLGATAIGNVLATLAGLAGGNTLTYQYSMPAGATVPSVPVVRTFNPCKSASAVNTAITLTVPGAAGNTSTNINIGGYQQ
jgi:hypothetical protein